MSKNNDRLKASPLRYYRAQHQEDELAYKNYAVVAEQATNDRNQSLRWGSAFGLTVLTLIGARYGAEVQVPAVNAVTPEIVYAGMVVMSSVASLYHFGLAGLAERDKIQAKATMRNYAVDGKKTADSGGLPIPAWVAAELGECPDTSSDEMFIELNTLEQRHFGQ